MTDFAERIMDWIEDNAVAILLSIFLIFAVLVTVGLLVQ